MSESYRIVDAFRNLFKRQRYELFLLTILNRSKVLIKNLPLEYNPKQSKGECDFVYRIKKGEEVIIVDKYEAKLLLDDEQGALLGERKNDIMKWFQSMRDEENENAAYFSQERIALFNEKRLYEIMKNRLLSVGDMILRNAISNEKEYIGAPELSEIIRYLDLPL